MFYYCRTIAITSLLVLQGGLPALAAAQLTPLVTIISAEASPSLGTQIIVFKRCSALNVQMASLMLTRDNPESNRVASISSDTAVWFYSTTMKFIKYSNGSANEKAVFDDIKTIASLYGKRGNANSLATGSFFDDLIREDINLCIQIHKSMSEKK